MQNSIYPNPSSTLALLIQNLSPINQGENGNAHTGNALPFLPSFFFSGTLGVLTTAFPNLPGNHFLGSPVALFPPNPFPTLTLHQDQTGTERRGGAIKRESPNVEPYRCKFCRYTSPRKHNVKEHQKKHNPNRERKYKCQKCEKAFFRRFDRERHIDSVHEKIRYVCPICCRGFSRLNNLGKHKCQPQNARRICNQKFTSPGSLKKYESS